MASFERHTNPGFVPTCRLCQSINVDEAHYLFHCPYFNDRRHEWCDVDFRPADDDINLGSYLQLDDCAELFSLANFISFIFETVENIAAVG